MKRVIFLFVLFFNLSANAQTNAQSIAAVEGKSAEPKQLLLADPYVLEDDGWYYIYGTHAEDGIVVYRSRDMHSWSDLCGKAKGGLALHRDDVWGEKWFGLPRCIRLVTDTL